MVGPEVLVVGEALVDIVRRGDDEPVEHPGGSPANVALGLGRLGRDVALLTRIGDDARGRAIAARLGGSDVAVLPASFTSEPTSAALATIDADGVASYEFDLDWHLPESAARALTHDLKVLHTGSIAAFLEPGGDQVIALVEAAAKRMTVSYDPNARPRLMGEAGAARRRVERIVAHAGLVKVSDEDLTWLAPGEDPRDVAEAWHALGPAVVVVTRGPDGAFARCPAGLVEVPGRTVDVVDTVGAGDSFMSALIDHLLGANLMGADRREQLRAISREQVAAMLEHAITISAITCGRAGADPPRRDELPA